MAAAILPFRKARQKTYNLQLNGFAIQFNRSDFEVYPDGADVAFRVGVILARKAREKKKK